MPEIVYNVKFRIKQEQVGKQGVADITRYEQTIERLKNTINQQAAAAGNATTATKKYVDSMKGTTQVQGNANKQLAIGNQLFFSLSDGIQDSAQFSQGFAQGMRAIGNNIGFTAELMGSFIQRTKEMNNGVLTGTAFFKSLAGSFFGVGGIILAINLAVTAMTNYSARQEKAIRDTQRLSDETQKLTSSLKSLIENAIEPNADLADEAFDVEKMARRLFEINRLTEDYRSSLESDVRSFLEKGIGGQVTDELVKRTTDAFLKGGTLAQGYTQDVTDQQRIRFEALRELVLDGEKEVLETQKRIAKASITLQSAVARDIVAATQTVEEADEKTVDKAFEERYKIRAGIQARSREAQRQIRELEAGREIQDEEAKLREIARVANEVLDERAKEELMTSSQVALARLKIRYELEDGLNRVEEKRAKDDERRRLDQIRAERQRLLEQEAMYRDYVSYIEQLERQKASAVASINQNVFSTLSSLTSVFSEKYKGLALAVLAVEKGLKIAEVITSASKEIGKIQMKALSDIAIYGPVIGGSLAGKSLAMIPLIKASAAASIAAITAAGIGEGSRIMGGGRGSGGAGGGGGSTRGGEQPRFGFSTENRPMYSPQPRQGASPVTLNVTNKIDRRGLALLVRDGEGALQSASIISTSA